MNILITGGSGALGTELVRQLNPIEDVQKIIIYSRDEAKQAKLKAVFGEDKVRYRVGDIRDLPRLKMAMRDCDVVIHAAAMKRIDTCEEEVFEAVKTNVEGSINVALACAGSCVDTAILVSSDKACNPCSVYGTTKLLAEHVFIQANNYGKCKFACLRYGNVVGSTGSIHQMWSNRLKGSKIMVTHDQMTRWFWTVEEAAEFCKSKINGCERGVIYIPKMISYNIMDIALEHACRDDIDITGLRCNEKIHEELVTHEEADRCYENDMYYTIYPYRHEWCKKLYPSGRRVSSGFTYRSGS
jgi:UDP-N-acetylglucosamine 4,6-dehydratase